MFRMRNKQKIYPKSALIFKTRSQQCDAIAGDNGWERGIVRGGEQGDGQQGGILERDREGLLRLRAFAFLLSYLLEGRRKQERGKEEKEGEVVRGGKTGRDRARGKERRGVREILKLRPNTRSRQDYQQIT